LDFIVILRPHSPVSNSVSPEVPVFLVPESDTQIGSGSGQNFGSVETLVSSQPYVQ